ncbi:unnamed protein product [Ectocarpus sp. 8 AP-2014]
MFSLGKSNRYLLLEPLYCRHTVSNISTSSILHSLYVIYSLSPLRGLFTPLLVCPLRLPNIDIRYCHVSFLASLPDRRDWIPVSLFFADVTNTPRGQLQGI